MTHVHECRLQIADLKYSGSSNLLEDKRLRRIRSRMRSKKTEFCEYLQDSYIASSISLQIAFNLGTITVNFTNMEARPSSYS